jgi:twinkle protein
MRLAEIALYISGTGSGKSSLIREIIAHLVETLPKEEKIGAVFLEDAPGETARLFAALGVNRNSSDEDITLEELRPGFDAMFGEDRIVVLDHQGTIKDNSIISQLEYMCLVGCKYLFVDHITILVSEGMNDLTGNELIDAIMNELLRLVKRHNVHIGLVSHLRKVPGGKKSFEEGQMPTLDDIRGSGSIKQVSFDVIAFARNMAAEDEEESKHVKMAVLKSRKTGKTGPVSGVYYVEETGRFISAEDAMISI